MRRSFAGPLLLLVIGSLFLWHNLHPDAHIFDALSRYWPFVLIAWGLIRLVEVLIWRDPNVRRGFSGGEVVLIILICLVGTGLWNYREHAPRFVMGGLDLWGQQYEYPVSVTASAAGMKRIVFENPRGFIKVVGSDTKDVTITGHKTIRAFTKEDADRTETETPVEIIPQGDRLMVRTSQDRVRNNQRITDDLEITVPRGMSVESRGTSGDHEITDIEGDVEINTGRGDVRLTRIGGNARLDVGRSELIRVVDVKGRVDVQGRGNDLEVENAGGQVTVGGTYGGTLDFKNLAKPLQFEGSRGTELSAQAVPGRINMDLGEFNARDVVGPMRVVTRARDIKVQQVTQSLEVQTERGDIELTPGRTPLPSIDAQSGSGKIELLLPENASFQLDGTAERGDALNDYGPSIQQEHSGRSATLKGRVGDGPSIKLTAKRGSISVRKEGTLPSEEIPDSKGKTPKRVTPRDLKDSEVKM
ncbi:MAG TPA: DUF4097 family beta strand repeat-containing protein [Candidatus Acidoferrum sp.]|nr:DUF4097 family beta strand repeat-containing protein [Candidatus Acidoferrum sp.]